MAKPAVGTPDGPRLPAQLEPLAPAPDDLDGAGWWQRSLEGADLSGATSGEAEIEQCRFTRVNLAQASVRGTTFVDTVIDHGDWANAEFTGCGMRRVECTGSRLTGLTFIDGVVRDVTWRDCRMDLTNWRATGFTSVHFAQCDLARADFAGADLRGARFTECGLQAAQFSNARLAGARFEGCDLAAVGGIGSFAGATIRSGDLFSLTELFARELGITIEADVR